MLDRFVFWLFRLFVKPVIELYLRRDRRTRFDGFAFVVRRGVFHPLFFFSTRYLYDFIGRCDLSGRTFLEIGSGSGLLSLLAYRKGAEVTAIDVDPVAVNCTRENFARNFPAHRAKIIESDLFGQLAGETFDFIFVNPPYYFKDATHHGQQAWYCGEQGEYFDRLFAGIGIHLHIGSQAFMILAENCEIERIAAIARRYGISLVLHEARKIMWETSIIYRVSANADASRARESIV